MGFIYLTFITAFGIEALGTYVSIIGLSALFGSNPVIMAVAIALDVGKLLVVSMLYTYWSRLGFLMKTYALIAAAVTMTITSAGAAGYLSGEFQKAIMGSQENTLKIEVLTAEQTKLEARKAQIDKQIAELPSNYSRSRITLMKEFSDEQKQITDRLTQLNTDLPALQIAQIGVETKVGPIVYISKAFDIPVEEAVKYVILLIVFVFDPLAVFLIIAGNFLLHLRRTSKEGSIAEADLFEEPIRQGRPTEPVFVDMPPISEDAPQPTITGIAPPNERGITKSFVDEQGSGPMAKTYDESYVPHEFLPAQEPEEGPMAKTYDDTHVAHDYLGADEPSPVEDEVPEAPPVTREVRDVITREQLQPVQYPSQYFSTLGSVKADDSVTFDETPTIGIAGQYRNLT